MSLNASDGMRLDEENFLEALSRVGYGKKDTVGQAIFNFLDETCEKSISLRTFRELDTFTKITPFEPRDVRGSGFAEELDDLCGHKLAIFPSPPLRGRVLLRPPKPQRHVGGGQSGGAGFLAGFGSGFCPAPPEIHRNLQI